MTGLVALAVIGYLLAAIGTAGLVGVYRPETTVLPSVLLSLFWPLTVAFAVIVMTYDLAAWCVLWVWLWVREK